MPVVAGRLVYNMEISLAACVFLVYLPIARFPTLKIFYLQVTADVL